MSHNGGSDASPRAELAQHLTQIGVCVLSLVDLAEGLDSAVTEVLRATILNASMSIGCALDDVADDLGATPHLRLVDDD